MSTTLVLGGARSGKSAWVLRAAEAEAARCGVRPTMIVTAQAFDDEMEDRIVRHRLERGAAWRTRETPLDLAGALDSLTRDDVAVVDCLTLWLTNVTLGEGEVEPSVAALRAAVARCPARLWLVSNEVGWGVVPDNALARRFRDEAGRLHQALAADAATVVLIVAGLPLGLKGAV